MSSTVHFPKAFLWGAATSSHQIEGGNRWNDWWEFEQSGRLPYRSEAACQHYERYEQDFDLARTLGHNAHRLSLEWSRVEPAEGQWNKAALDHYVSVIEAVRQRHIEPIVTLHHFTNPAWFTQQGGWTRRRSVDLFRRYVDVVVTRLAPNVRYWITVNEPTVYMKRAYIAGSWPPCHKGDWLSAHRVLRNLCRAHAAAYGVIHDRCKDALVGFAHSAPFIAPCDPTHKADRVVAACRDFLLNDYCFQLLGSRPRDTLDFIGLNYYAREVVHWGLKGTALFLGRECREHRHAERSFSSLGWEIYPNGLYQVLLKFSRFGLPLVITENGIATENETERSDYLQSHLRALAAAVAGGIDVRGYLYWTLYDNYEWSEGFAPKFGLCALDRSTGARQPRTAAWQFKAVCQSNSVAALPDAQSPGT